MINSKQSTILFAFLFIVSNSYADDCSNVISSNLIDETIAISNTKTISINPWSVIQFNTDCTYDSGWNISSNIGGKEAGNDNIDVAYANITVSKDDYKMEIGRFENNMSFNSVFGFALPMGTIPAIQLDEASYSQTVAPDINLIRVTRNTGFGSIYLTGYHADKDLHHQSNLDNSFNGGIAKRFNDHINIEVQYANESVEDVDTRQERLSLFFNILGSLRKQRKWSVAAEINGFKNRDFVSNDDDATANLYLEISQKNILPGIDAYASTGGSYDNQNQASVEVGVFVNISTLLKMSNNISINAGAAQSGTIFEGGDDISTDRYSVQLRYKM